MDLIKENVKVEWEQLGEGRDGEYNPNDPNDQEYLRFYISKQSPNGTWENLDDGSFCTLFPVSASHEQKEKALVLIIDKVFDEIQRGGSIKKICEELSWISPRWFI